MSFLTRPGPETAPVRRVCELPAIESRTVRCLRLRAAGEAGRVRLARDLGAAAGPGVAALAAARLDAILGLIADHGSRPLRLAAPDDPGALGDECVLARLVALAAEGGREEAVLMSTLVIRPDLALALAREAEALGCLLARVADGRPEDRRPRGRPADDDTARRP